VALRDAVLPRVEADLQTNAFDDVSLTGARYNNRTHWPTSFDPKRHSVVRA
jgi:hypothetical protein